jgi:chromosome segregation ATPase
MDIELLIYCITVIVSALGIKEIWGIWKRKIEIKNRKEQIDEITKDQITSQVIEELKRKINGLEEKIDDLLKMNKECAVKLARLEERFTLLMKKNSNKRKPKETSK